MKVNFLVTLPVLACMMAACSSDDSPSTHQSSSAITFTSYVDQSTKASMSDIDKLHEDGFRVIAVDHANDWSALPEAEKTPDFMYHQEILWNTEMNAYQYSPVKYWPVDGHNVSFFAYSPGELLILRGEGSEVGLTPSAHTATVSPNLDYTMSPYCRDQIDLVTARALNCSAQTSNTHGQGAVYFEFTHALSKIGFAAKLRDELQPGTTLTVHDLTLRYMTVETRVEGMGGIIRRGQYYMDTKSWTLQADELFTTSPEFGDPLLGDDVVVSSTTTAVALNADDKYLMLIPQSYPSGAVEVDISYTITYQDPADANAEVVTTLERTTTMRLPAIYNDVEQNIGWEQNKSYTYVIVIGPDAISFDSPEIHDWRYPIN